MTLTNSVSGSQDFFSLKNNFLGIRVKKAGAELCSIQRLSDGQEYIWEADPAVWGSSSPVLFPIVGILKDETYLLDGKSYRMKKHGLFKYSPDVELASATENSLTFRLLYNETTLKRYPFRFEFLVTFRLEAQRVVVMFEVRNLDEKELYFTLGAHPAFKCPLNKGEKYNDYFLDFEQRETAYNYPILPSGLLGEKSDLILKDTAILPLHDGIFDKDALVFKDIRSRSVTLSSRISGKRVRVNYAGFPYLGFWAKPKADFVCIEPWYGLNDPVDTDQNFKTKEGILKLSPESCFQAEYSIEIL